MDNQGIRMDTFREILHASAKAADIPIEQYIEKMIGEEEFSSPELSQEMLVVIKFKIMLNHTEKKLQQIRENLNKIQKDYQSCQPESQIPQKIQDKLEIIEQLLLKIRKARLNINYHLS